jgi:hypothetical protein
MTIERIEEMMKAIQVAESCINSVLSVNPSAVDQSVFGVLAELKMDLLDAKDELMFGEIA